MPTSAIYGSGVYEDSRYGVILIKGNTSIAFTEVGRLKGKATSKLSTTIRFDKGKAFLSQIVNLKASSSLKFQNRASLKGIARTNLRSILKFTTFSRLKGIGKSKARSNLIFLTKANAFGHYRLSGSVDIDFNTSGNLTLRKITSGNTKLNCFTEGLVRGTANTKLKSTFTFDPETDISGVANGSFVSRFDFRSKGILVGNTALIAKSESQFITLSILNGIGLIPSARSSISFTEFATLNRVRLIPKRVTLNFNVSSDKLLAVSSLPWYNTIETNKDGPYDTKTNINYLNIYENIEGSYKRPYELTQKEVA